MFWGDKMVSEIEKRYAEKIKKNETLIIRDEKTLSGRVHVGSLRGVVIHGTINEILQSKKIKSKFIFELNDFDPMDGLPSNLDEKKWSKYMGMPLCNIPAPDKKANNYAEFYGNEFTEVIKELGYDLEYYRASEKYRSGDYNDAIKLALENADKIRQIYLEVSGGKKPDDWHPLSVICQECGRIGTTKVIDFDGKEVTYICEPDMVTWAKGCGHQGKISPFDGNAKLPWKVEWAAKFKIFDVSIEGAGKDHATKGGSRDIADRISREIFKHNPPYDIPYNFLVLGGKKMSSSKGLGVTSRDMADLLPPEKLRFLLIRKQPRHEIDFNPEGDTISMLYDAYDIAAEEFYAKTDSDKTRIFELSHPPKDQKLLEPHFLPRFSQLAFLAQMPHTDMLLEAQNMKGEPLTDLEKFVTKKRVKESLYWIDTYSPEDFKFKLFDQEIPAGVKKLDAEQKAILGDLAEMIANAKKMDGQEFHTAIHDLKKEKDIEPAKFFQAIYISLLNKESGPKAGWFLSVLDKDFLIKRFQDIAKF